ncbi:hypothetical protein [Tumebacillus flagellatus]|uniref:DUF2007 domain-containing protein n=1 Tax=Tumebacillus flagellatus TaxID=1157490 RepID=A0A074MDT2_9BACL|nr:hypothetical protein [Tumebacillus flagellatus]KEO83997.1 hypothetical protein EL26_07375 [Tumebacillus flagellatus]
MFRFFSKYKKLVYTSFGSESYFKAVGKLQAAGIPYSTKTPGNLSALGSSSRLGPDMTQYDLYVKPQDEACALEAIHRSM